MQIYIHRGNEDFGPYSREAVLEYVKQGVFESLDYACYAGMSEWKTIGELLGINGPEKGAAKGHSSTKITEFRSAWETAPMKPAVMYAGGGRKRTFMIILNVCLACVVILVGYVRLAGGGKTVRHFVGGLSGILGKWAQEPPADNAQPDEAVSKASVGSPSTREATPSPGVASPLSAGGVSGPSRSASPGPESSAASPSIAGAPSSPTLAAASPSESGSPGGYVAPPVPGASPSNMSNTAPAGAATPATAAGPGATGAAPPVGSGGGYVPPAGTGASHDFDAAANPTLSANSPSPSAGVPASSVSASSTPAATPTVVAEASPTPVPVATPPPRPSFNIDALAANPKAWPRTLKLKRPVDFPDVVGTQVMGTVTVPAGSIVDLLDIQGDKVTVKSFGGGKQAISYKLTDLEEQVGSGAGRGSAPVGF